jgi:hypothetical protein
MNRNFCGLNYPVKLNRTKKGTKPFSYGLFGLQRELHPEEMINREKTLEKCKRRLRNPAGEEASGRCHPPKEKSRTTRA